MRQRHLPTLGLSWSHLPTLGPGIWTGSCGNGIFQLSVCGISSSSIAKRAKLQLLRRLQYEKLQLLRPLQYCRETERNCNYYDRSSIADWEKQQLQRPLQYCRERNCNYYGRTSIAEREKLQLLRPPQYCRLGETAITSTARVLQKKQNLQLLRPLQYCRERERNCTY